MIYSGNILKLSFSEVTQYGVSDGYLKKALYQNRQRGGKGSWKHWPDPDDRRKCLIDYDSIPATTVKKYDLPEKSYFLNILKEQERDELTVAQKAIDHRRQTLKEEVREETSIREYYLERLKEVGVKSRGLYKTCVNDYTRLAGWLRMIAPYNRQTARDYGFKSMVEFNEFLMDLINGESLHNFNVKNERSFQRKVKPFRSWLESEDQEELKATALDSLISGKLNLANHTKMSSWHIHQLIGLAANGRQLNPSLLHHDLNAIAKSNRKEEVSAETVRLHLRKPEFKTKLALAREGKMKWMNEKMFIIDRDGASMPDALWWIDGTPEELWYCDINDGKRMKRLEVIKVLDDYSKCVVGYSIGRENIDNVYKAVKNAVNFRGYIAHQLTSDKGSALNSIAMKEWFQKLFGGAKGFTPATAGLARAKIIEPMQAIFRQQILARDKNHSFGNITSKGPQANPEYIKANWQDFPKSEEELIRQIDDRINRWNHRADSNGNVPIELYEETHENRRSINQMLFQDLFFLWLPKPIKYSAQGLKFRRNNQEYTYIAPCAITPDSSEEDCQLVAQFTNENIDRKFEVKFDPDNTDRVALYYQEAFVCWAYNKIRTKRALYDTDKYDGQLLKKYRLVQKFQEQDADKFIKDNQNYIEAEGMVKSAFSVAAVHKNDRNEAGSVIKSLAIDGGRTAEVEVSKRKGKWAI